MAERNIMERAMLEEGPPRVLTIAANSAEVGVLYVLPTCSSHPGSVVRRYRARGPNGPGVYPQCVPDGSGPHLLSWPEASSDAPYSPDMSGLTPSELEVLEDAARGLSVIETGASRTKSPETVKTQRRSILLKLGARNIAHAVAMMISGGLIAVERPYESRASEC
jgi:DNA-binding CsgD family transcriptional regulator